MSYHFWTEEESALLVAAVKKYGFRWEEIQFKVFPGLSVAKLKNKFYSDRRFKADAALPLTDEEKLGLKRRKRAPVCGGERGPVERGGRGPAGDGVEIDDPVKCRQIRMMDVK
ncbi:Myb-like_DNA-binding domain-containing protein [Hexamita inflata]|uniref:Myb-like DNA-binding domain-containing protein n=1 Tax=Hexamita inflata TaxID=28002 RepID=A0AA86PJY5_9EUKA|nr:Myb-like DNA-binding domain-containing protein [Hexamita inflata]